MNTITISLCEEDRKRADELIGSITLLATVLGSMQPASVRQEIIEKATAACAEGHPADASTAHLEPPAPASAPEPPAPASISAIISLGEFQKAIVTRCAESADTKLKVQALVHRYAESVSAIPEEKRQEVLSALSEI